MNNRIIGLFYVFVFFIFVIGVAFLFFAVSKPAGYFTPKKKEIQTAIRGSIYTKEYILAKSNKLYGVYIYPKYIDPDKWELFYKLFSIYTNIPESKLKKTLRDDIKKGYKRIRLATVDLKTKQSLEYLRKVLDKKRVFLADGRGIRRGYGIESLDFKRVYPYKDTLEPFLGRYRYDKRRGENGLEEYYDNLLRAKQNGYRIGYRDVYGNLIFDNHLKSKKTINGDDLPLNINLVLQRKIEKLISFQKEKFQADEVLAAVMNSKTGQLLAIASSNRYDPLHISKKDIANMKIGAVRDVFEPGSVMKPIIFAILLEHNKVNPYETLDAHNGVWRVPWRKKPIRDDEAFKTLTAEEGIIHSSNIVLSELALRLSAKEYFDGLRQFGFSKPTGIDLPYELSGKINPLRLFRFPVYKSTTAFGYGIDVTFVQLLKAYNAFNDDGIEIAPRLAELPTPFKRVISAKNARIMLGILRKVVLSGTGKKAFVKGIFTAGKTGTAHVSKGVSGYSQDVYDSSFVGFANDKNHRYTIAVTFFNVKAKWPDYFAAANAVPTFKKIVDIMINENILRKSDGK